MDRDVLQRRWHDLLDPFGAAEAAVGAAFDEVAAHYGEPRRRYHTLEHVRSVLDRVDQLRDLTDDALAVELAAWLHDVVYDSRAGDNEARSAALAADLLRSLQVPPPTTERVAHLILTTVDHQAAGQDVDADVLLDADLAVLGADQDAYDEYRAAIREEYGWLPNADYRAGRAALLRRFLERGDIFHTPPMKQELEARARANMRRELRELEPTLRD